MTIRVTLDDYIQFKIPKRTKPGQPKRYRTLHAPKPDLKAEQEHLLHQLMRLGRAASPYAFAYVRKRGLLDMANKHVGATYALKLDLRDFFPSVRPAMLLPANLDRIPGYSWRQIYELTFLPVAPNSTALNSSRSYEGVPYDGLPQGAPTSPFLSNLAARRMDYALAAYLRRSVAKPLNMHIRSTTTSKGTIRNRSVCYPNPLFGEPLFNMTRYADDITISGSSAKVHNVEFSVKKIIESLGFTVNNRKTKRIKKGGRIEVCGVVVNDHPNAKRSYRRDVRVAVHKAVRDVIAGRCDPGFYISDGKLTPVDVLALQGKLSFICQLNPDLAMNTLKTILLEVHGLPRTSWSYNTQNYLQPNERIPNLTGVNN
jgi:RNA-directed DNA polymerase